MLSFFPRGVLDEIMNLIESVSEDFPSYSCTFQATIGGKFAPLIGRSDEDMDIDTTITTYITAVTDAASEILGKKRRRKKKHGSPKMFSTSVMRGEI